MIAYSSGSLLFIQNKKNQLKRRKITQDASHNRKSCVCSQRISHLFHTKLMKKRKKGEKLEKHTNGSRPKLGKLLNVGEK